ncbi:MAG: RNA polymerase sigma-70 factor [Phocaeicola sp.]|uniref:RNA polymerase sigma-70 factor n=1 Tax=Phocaeicola TaxID=909656 RepID=UPI00234F0589|nr:RNA polymerase sigma-70 factor [Phocaeicola oris]MCE2617627.1 RNA polymerase sigma-70 factor [Phocaeicola oris]
MIQVKSEIFLLNQLREGNHTAFNIIYKQYYVMLCTYANRFVDLEDAKNIVEELMIWLWEHREDLLIDISLKSYLFRSTYNRVLNLIAKKKVDANSEAQFCEYYLNPVIFSDDYDLHELLNKVDEAIQNLPESYRETFIMSRLKNMTYNQIAEKCGVSSKTINYRITQALSILRVKLKDFLPLILFLLKDSALT